VSASCRAAATDWLDAQPAAAGIERTGAVDAVLDDSYLL
jgi:hypothetical protein